MSAQEQPPVNNAAGSNNEASAPSLADLHISDNPFRNNFQPFPMPYNFNQAKIITPSNPNLLWSDPDAPPPSYESVMSQASIPSSSCPYPIQNINMPTPMNLPYPQQNFNTFLTTNQPTLPPLQQSSSANYISTSKQTQLGTSPNASRNYNPRRFEEIPTKPEITETGHPTVRPEINFDPAKDALDIFKALQSREPNTMILSILCRRSLEQRLIIGTEFENINGKSLIEEINAQLLGNFKTLMTSLLLPLDILNVRYLHRALEKCDHGVIAEILCTKSNDEIKWLKFIYKKTFGFPLERFISDNTGVNFEKLMLAICDCLREEKETKSISQIRYEAQQSCKILNSGNKYDSNSINLTFIEIFTKKSFQHIKMICQEYEKMFKRPIERKIKSEFSHGDKKGYSVIVRYVMDKHEYYATQLYKNTTGFIRNNEDFIRIVVSRSEIDLEDIKYKFSHVLEENIIASIEGVASGYYKQALFMLFGLPNQLGVR